MCFKIDSEIRDLEKVPGDWIYAGNDSLKQCCTLQQIRLQ